MTEKIEITPIVKKHYANVAKREAGCCSNTCGCGEEMSAEEISRAIGYSDEDLTTVPEANLGLGCGNPIALGRFNEGETVVDLGSGAGIDCFLAAKKVGPTGQVIGVDMFDDMLEKARGNAKIYGFENVEFRKGYIDQLPIDDASVDIIISNCVINLAPDKLAVFKDAFRVLKKGGRMYISDMVLTAELTPEQRADESLIAGCVGGALLKDDYLTKVKEAGFRYEVMMEDREISKTQYGGLPVISLKLGAYKD